MGESKKTAQEVTEDAVEEVVIDQVETGNNDEVGEAEGPADGSDLEIQLEEAQAKAEENWDKLLRAQAELDNLRRRAERDVGNAHKYALERFAQDLLPVVDSMEMGVAVSAEPGAEVEKLHEGSEITLKMATDVLEKYGIKQIDPQGEKFNPEFHQAMSTMPAEGVEPNTVITVYQKGYLLNDRLIRPAMVVVSKASPAAEDAMPKIDEHA